MRRFGVTLVALSCVAAATPAFAQGRLTGRGAATEQKTPEGQKPIQKEEKKFPLGASWVAISLNGKPYSGSERPSFAMDDRFRVRGFGGCNSFSATAFPLREQGIAVGPLAMTKRSCDASVMAVENAFFAALRTSAKWDTVIGSLVIKGPNGEIKLERSL